MTTTNTTSDNKAFSDAPVIDLCAISATAWHERIEQSGITAMQTSVTWPRDDASQALRRIQNHRAMVASEDRFDLVLTVEDILRCKEEGRVGHILGTINTDMLGRDASVVEVFHAIGIRVMQLNYNERNFASDGCLETTNAGLSFFGRELIQAMNEAGVLIELADAGIQSSLDAIELSDKPTIFSHVNPRATALEQQRNVTDDQIKACASKGGVIGLVPHGPLCAVADGEWPTIKDFVRHVEYVVELVGIDHVGFGSDSEATPGGVAPELALQMGEVGRIGRASTAPSIGSVSRGMGMAKPRTKPMSYFEMAQALHNDSWGAKDLEHLGKLPNLANVLTASGWSDEDMLKLMGGNMLRVYEECWSVAE